MEVAGHEGGDDDEHLRAGESRCDAGGTMNVYGHVSLDEKRAALDELGKLFGEET